MISLAAAVVVLKTSEAEVKGGDKDSITEEEAIKEVVAGTLVTLAEVDQVEDSITEAILHLAVEIIEAEAAAEMMDFLENMIPMSKIFILLGQPNATKKWLYPLLIILKPKRYDSTRMPVRLHCQHLEGQQIYIHLGRQRKTIKKAFKLLKTTFLP